MADNSELMTDLLPCPFCGSDKVAVGHTNLGYEALCFYYGVGCKSRTGIWPTRTEAIAAWNRRIPVTAEAGEVSEAEASDFAIVEPKGRRIAWGTRGQADAIDLSDAYPEILEPGYRVEWLCPILAARRVQPRQDAPSPDVAGLVEALRHALVHIYSFRAQLRDPLAQTVLDEVAREGQAAIEAALSRLTPPKQDDAG